LENKTSSLQNFGYHQRPQWWAKFEEVKAFQRANGTLVVRQSEDQPLYLWIHRQKKFMQTDVSSMNEDHVLRFNALKTIGFEN
jgi:hypothetical protein